VIVKVNVAQSEAGRRVFVLALDKGDEVMKPLAAFVEANDVRGGHLVALGALSDVRFGFFERERRGYREFELHEQVEVASMVGTIGWTDSGPVVHAHLVVGLDDGRALGGHLLEARAWPTLEIVVTEVPARLDKAVDAETGLALFDF
jgi:predicted DNA-binding protein with PD1-like motif